MTYDVFYDRIEFDFNSEVYMKKIVLCMFLLLMSACSVQPAVEKRETVVFTDDTGAVVEVMKKPERTAVLMGSYADIWLNASGTIVASVQDALERGLIDEDVKIVGSGKEVNSEQLLAVNPDFVILSTDYPNHIELDQLLKDAGIPHAYFQIDSFDQYLNVLNIFTDIMDNKDAYETYGTKVKANVDAIFDQLADIQSNQKVLLLRAYSTGMKAKAADNFVGEMLDELKADNIAEHAEILLDELSMEVILKENPEIIFVTMMGSDTQAAIDYVQNEMQSEAWQQVDAVKNDQVIFLDKELYHYKPNARWDEAYEGLAKVLYPDLFK